MRLMCLSIIIQLRAPQEKKTIRPTVHNPFAKERRKEFLLLLTYYYFLTPSRPLWQGKCQQYIYNGDTEGAHQTHAGSTASTCMLQSVVIHTYLKTTGFQKPDLVSGACDRDHGDTSEGASEGRSRTRSGWWLWRRQQRVRAEVPLQ